MNLLPILLLPLEWYFLWALCVPLCLTIIPLKPYRKYLASIILFPILCWSEYFYRIDHDLNCVSIPLVLQGVFFNLILYTFNLFFLVEYPEITDFRPAVETLEEVHSLETCTWKKFKWCVQRSLLFTVTGHGWNWHNPKSVKSDNVSFKFTEFSLYLFLSKFILKYIIYDLFLHLYLSTDYIKFGGWGKGHLKDLVLFSKDARLNPAMQIVLAIGTVYCIYFGIDTLYTIFVVLNVYVFKVYKLQDFPPLFGSFEGYYTVKSFWGNVWHKLMYQFSVPQAMFLAGCDYKSRHINIEPRFGIKKWNYYLMLLFVFLFTGLYHATGTLNMPWKKGTGYNVNVPIAYDTKFVPSFIFRCFYSFIFFPLQFGLIILETFAINKYKKYIKVPLPNKILKLIGFTWIATSEIYLMQLYVDEMVKSGFNIEDLVVAYSPVHYIYKMLGY